MDWNNAFVGALVGGALTAVGFLYKRRIENLAILNRSLYQLLILYGSVNSAVIRPSAIAKIAVEVLQELFPNSKNDPSMAGAEELYSEMISELYKTADPKEEDLLQMYLGTVESLSAVDPVLAYRLSANAGLKRYLVAADEQMAKFRSSAATELSEKEIKFVKVFHEEGAELISKEVLRELKIDLLILSIRCGFIQFIAVSRRVCRKPGISAEEAASLKATMKSLLEDQLKDHQVGT